MIDKTARPKATIINIGMYSMNAEVERASIKSKINFSSDAVNTRKTDIEKSRIMRPIVCHPISDDPCPKQKHDRSRLRKMFILTAIKNDENIRAETKASRLTQIPAISRIPILISAMGSQRPYERARDVGKILYSNTTAIKAEGARNLL
jgi:hypothetical protein